VPIENNEPTVVRKQIEVLHGMQAIVEKNLHLLAPVADAWQPSDYLPDLSAPTWREDLEKFRAPAEQLSDEVLVILVGNMVTEEALPSYAISLNLIAADESGDSQTPWARWMRGWTGEENRHGDLLNTFLRFTGRTDMHSIELTIHHLIANGFNPRAYPDAYSGLVYTSFQERATKLSHARVGALAMSQGNTALAKIAGKIAHDESRHEQFYKTMMNEVFNIDPERAMLCFRSLMRRIIAMPGRLMYDGKDPNLFDHFAAVAQRLGVYTVHDYIAVLRHLVAEWKIAGRSVAGKAAAAQDFLCKQADHLEAIAEAVATTVVKQPPVAFSWIKDRSV
jgi:acyl-[acyl-carrier-protein] desaturase